MANESAATARLFFAAWPAPEVQRTLHDVALRARPECGGRAVPQRNIHLTIAFLGNLERHRMHEIEAAAAATRCASCELLVGHLGYWRHNRIVWAGVEVCPDALRELVARLSAGLRAAGCKLDDRRPYVPHVTLLRNARCGPAQAAFPPVAWAVGDFALVESRQRDGARAYEVLRRWRCEG